MKTVVMRLNGGMGNQMFQYAFAKALAKRAGATLLLDRSMFDLPYTPETYRLDAFDLAPRFTGRARNLLHRLLLSPKIPGGLRSALARLARTEIVDGHVQIAGNRSNVLLVGYYQYPQCFTDALPVLRHDFRLPIGGARARACLDRIRQGVSVAVHVRRGDYADVPLFRENLGVLSADYYRAAIAEARNRLGPARFFFFTNDPDWVSRSLLPGMADGELVSLGADGKDTTEMALMRACSHFIVANSTFSWWPALLGDAEDKTVIAPDPWFRGSEVTGEELLLPEWVKCRAIWDI